MILQRIFIVLLVFIVSQINVFGETTTTGNLKTYTVVSKIVPEIYSATGTVESRTETDISPRITSRIMKVFVRSGDHVKKDQILIQLEDNALQASVLEVQNKIDSMAAAIRSAKQAVNSATAEAELAKTEKERSDKLYAKKAFSTKQYEQSASNYKKAVAELNQAKQNVESLIAEKKAAEQTLERSKTLLSYSSIKSSMDGVVGERSVDPGDLAVPCKILMRIFDPKRLMLEVPIRESLIRKIKLGEKIVLNIAGLKKKFYAEIKEIVPYVDTKTRTFLVKACIDKSEGLIPGMYGVTDIKVGTKKELLIPTKAITRIGQVETVLIMVGENTKKIFVRTIPSPITNMRVVLSGLKENDKVVSGGKKIDL